MLDVWKILRTMITRSEHYSRIRGILRIYFLCCVEMLVTATLQLIDHPNIVDRCSEENRTGNENEMTKRKLLNGNHSNIF